MDFGVPAPNSSFKIYEACPKCKVKFAITDRSIILDNRLITCSSCGYKFKLNINL